MVQKKILAGQKLVLDSGEICCETNCTPRFFWRTEETELLLYYLCHSNDGLWCQYHQETQLSLVVDICQTCFGYDKFFFRFPKFHRPVHFSRCVMALLGQFYVLYATVSFHQNLSIVWSTASRRNGCATQPAPMGASIALKYQMWVAKVPIFILASRCWIP